MQTSGHASLNNKQRAGDDEDHPEMALLKPSRRIATFLSSQQQTKLPFHECE
jgi:hypothetical protein